MIATASARLLRAILADPADDTARLAYSDWLEEEGQDERAEFIRVQVELADQCPDCTYGCPRQDCRRCQLRSRERELLAAPAPGGWTPNPGNGYHWSGPVLWHAGVEDVTWRYRRGFVAEVSCTAADFVRHAAALFSAHPIERVTLTDRKPGVRFLLSNGFDNGGWIWGRASDYSPTPAAWPHHLPKPLWEVMAARGAEGPFADQQLALDALARVCVAYGRRLAGLPALD